jgi:hypothetical protein
MAGKSLSADRKRACKARWPASYQTEEHVAAFIEHSMDSIALTRLTLSILCRPTRQTIADMHPLFVGPTVAHNMSGIRRRLNSGVTERTPMSFSTQELDLAIQLSLVAKIKEAAQRYTPEPAESGSTALRAYISALECLAEHIEAKCRESVLFHTPALPAHRLGGRNSLSAVAKPRTSHRVIPFPTARGSDDSPFTAA